MIDKHRLDVVNALEDIFHRFTEPEERVAAAREWFSHQWRLKDFIVLRMEFSRRAMKNRPIRKRLADLWRQDVETYAGSVAEFFAQTNTTPPERPEVIALALLAIVQGLGGIAIDTSPEMDHLYDAAARLVFDRLSAPESLQGG